MRKNLVYVGGSKGGTGKSMVCMALVDYFRKAFPKDTLLLVETDTSNPDVGRLYKNTPGIIVQGIPLGEDDTGWMDLVDEIDSTKAQHVLINSMAASNLGVQTQGTLLDQNVGNGNLDVAFKVFWVMNRNKDSVTLLRSFMDTMKSAVVYPVLNLYFGKEEEFSFYHTNEDLHEIISQRGGCQLTFPNLNDLIADKFYTDEVTIEKLPKGLKLGMRTVLERWLRVVKETFDVVFKNVENKEAVE